MIDLEAASKRAYDFLDQYILDHDSFGDPSDTDDTRIWVQYVAPDEHGAQVEVCISVGDDYDPEDPKIQRIIQQCMDALHAAHPDIQRIGTKLVVYK